MNQQKLIGGNIYLSIYFIIQLEINPYIDAITVMEIFTSTESQVRNITKLIKVFLFVSLSNPVCMFSSMEGFSEEIRIKRTIFYYFNKPPGFVADKSLNSTGLPTKNETFQNERCLFFCFFIFPATANFFLSLPYHFKNTYQKQDLKSPYFKSFKSSFQSHPLWVTLYFYENLSNLFLNIKLILSGKSI